MRKSNFALRLQPSLLKEARRLAAQDGVALNQFINVAVAEKLSALQTETYLRERAARADLPAVLALLETKGGDQPPVPGDELPAGVAPVVSPGAARRSRAGGN